MLLGEKLEVYVLLIVICCKNRFKLSKISQNLRTPTQKLGHHQASPISSQKRRTTEQKVKF